MRKISFLLLLMPKDRHMVTSLWISGSPNFLQVTKTLKCVKMTFNVNQWLSCDVLSIIIITVAIWWVAKWCYKEETIWWFPSKWHLETIAWNHNVCCFVIILKVFSLWDYFGTRDKATALGTLSWSCKWQHMKETR